MSVRRDFLSLPDDAISNVLSFCTYPELTSIASTCKHLQEVTFNSREAWISAIQSSPMETTPYVHPHRALESYTTKELRQACLRGQKRWQRLSSLDTPSPTGKPSREESIDIDPAKLILQAKLAPGGTHLVCLNGQPEPPELECYDMSTKELVCQTPLPLLNRVSFVLQYISLNILIVLFYFPNRDGTVHRVVIFSLDLANKTGSKIQDHSITTPSLQCYLPILDGEYATFNMHDSSNAHSRTFILKWDTGDVVHVDIPQMYFKESTCRVVDDRFIYPSLDLKSLNCISLPRLRELHRTVGTETLELPHEGSNCPEITPPIEHPLLEFTHNTPTWASRGHSALLLLSHGGEISSYHVHILFLSPPNDDTDPCGQLTLHKFVIIPHLPVSSSFVTSFTSSSPLGIALLRTFNDGCFMFHPSGDFERGSKKASTDRMTMASVVRKLPMPKSWNCFDLDSYSGALLYHNPAERRFLIWHFD